MIDDGWYQVLESNQIQNGEGERNVFFVKNLNVLHQSNAAVPLTSERRARKTSSALQNSRSGVGIVQPQYPKKNDCSILLKNKKDYEYVLYNQNRHSTKQRRKEWRTTFRFFTPTIERTSRQDRAWWFGAMTKTQLLHNGTLTRAGRGPVECCSPNRRIQSRYMPGLTLKCLLQTAMTR